MGPQVFQTRPCANPSSEKSRRTSQRRPYTRPRPGVAAGNAAAAASRLRQAVPGAGPSPGPSSGCRSSSLLQPEPMATRWPRGPCPPRSQWPPTSPARMSPEEVEAEAASVALGLAAAPSAPARNETASDREGWQVRPARRRLGCRIGTASNPPGSRRRNGSRVPKGGWGGIGKAGRSAAEPREKETPREAVCTPGGWARNPC